MAALRRLTDFFELRPTLSMALLRLCWWLYILLEVERLFRIDWFRIITSPNSPSWFLASGWSNAFFTLLRVVVVLATVRLFIDVVLKFITPSRGDPPATPPSWGQEALAFFDLRPFYTRWWLRVFWLLFLLSMLRTIYIQAVSGAWPFAPKSLESWFRYAIGFVGPLTWTVGVRLLIEAASSPRPRPREPTP